METGCRHATAESVAALVSDRQRRAKQLHAVRAPERRVLHWHGVGTGGNPEERLHVAGRREGDQDTTDGGAGLRPDVWDAARREQ